MTLLLLRGTASMRAGYLNLSEKEKEENQETNSIQWRERSMIENKKTGEEWRRAKKGFGEEQSH